MGPLVGQVHSPSTPRCYHTARRIPSAGYAHGPFSQRLEALEKIHIKIGILRPLFINTTRTPQRPTLSYSRRLELSPDAEPACPGQVPLLPCVQGRLVSRVQLARPGSHRVAVTVPSPTGREQFRVQGPPCAVTRLFIGHGVKFEARKKIHEKTLIIILEKTEQEISFSIPCIKLTTMV